VDIPVFVFALSMSAVTGVFFGLAPALRSSRREPDWSLNERSAIGGRSRSRLSHFALTGQVGLAVAVLVCSGLLVRSFTTVLSVDLGFQSTRTLVMAISLPQPKYDDAARRALFFDELVRHIDAVPGVVATGLVSHPPLRGPRLSTDFAVQGRPAAREASVAELVSIGGAFFDVLEIPIVQGRRFDERDAAGTPPVVVINQTLAQRFWPGADPVGQQLVVGSTLGADTRPRTIVGVAGDVRTISAERQPQPAIYVPYFQNPWPTMTVVTRTKDDPARLAAALRNEVFRLDRDQPVTGVTPMDQIVTRSTASRRFQMWLVAAFALLSVILAALGVYGVTAYGVGLRTQEFGVRRALGAGRMDIFRLAIGGALRSALAGNALGVGIALAAAHAIRSLLFGVSAADPLTFAVIPTCTALVVLVASGVAGRRATRADPLSAIRLTSR
jgi:putative ABC transport system permease protein